MTKYRYLTFDCYGTLIDWKTGIDSALRSALGRTALEGRELMRAYVEAENREESVYKRYRDVLRRTTLSLSDTLGVVVTESAAESFAGSVPTWPAFPDTAKFLRDMGASGYRRYILSNVDNDLLDETIRRNGLEVDGVVTAEEVGSYKPNAGHWLEFLRRTGATKDEILHVAQSIFHDIIPVQNLGIASAWINRYRENLPPDLSPTIISDDLDGLREVIGE